MYKELRIDCQHPNQREIECTFIELTVICI